MTCSILPRRLITAQAIQQNRHKVSQNRPRRRYSGKENKLSQRHGARCHRATSTAQAMQQNRRQGVTEQAAPELQRPGEQAAPTTRRQGVTEREAPRRPCSRTNGKVSQNRPRQRHCGKLTQSKPRLRNGGFSCLGSSAARA